MEIKFFNPLHKYIKSQIAAILICSAYFFNMSAMSQIETTTFAEQLNQIQKESQFSDTKRFKKDKNYFDLSWFKDDQAKVISNQTSKKLQALVDESFIELSKYDRFMQVVQSVLNSDPQLISKILGTSDRASSEIAELTNKSSLKIKIPNKIFYQREYVFVFTTNENLINSWTNLFNVTYVIVNPMIFSKDLFTRILLHELFMVMDFKEQFLTLPLKEGLFPKVAEDKICQIRLAIKDPMIKYAFNLIRGFYFENYILNSSIVDEKTEIQIDQCIQNVKEFLPFFEKIKSNFLPEQVLMNFVNFNQCTISELSLVEKMEIIRQSVVQLETGGMTQLCDYLTEPEISLWTFSPTIGGPRPRIGNGWGSLQPQQPSTAQINQFGLKYQNIKKNKNLEKYEVKSK